MNTESIERNYIYLLQKSEFNNIYKVGVSKKENEQYPIGTVLIFKMMCNVIEKVEENIIKIFKERFNQQKDIGDEYFEGDYHIMIDTICSTIKDNNDDNDEDDNDEDEDDEDDNNEDDDNDENDNDDEQIENHEEKFNSLCEKICKIFPNYKNDESFGGNKKYIKFNEIDDEYSIYYINPFLMDDLHNYYEDESETSFYQYIIIEYEMNKNVADKLEYFKKKLISNKTIYIDKIYDLKSNKFIDKINKTKFNIKIENYDEFKLYTLDIEIYSKIREKLRQLFECNMIINNCLYSTMKKEYDNYDIFKKFKSLKDFDNITVDIGVGYYIFTTIYFINNKFYDYKTYLRKYTPYLIRWNTDNNYYILNRDYEYIGINVKYIEYNIKGQSYLFTDENKPWEEKQNLKKLCDEYKKIIKEKELGKCLNKNEFTQNIISLYN